MDGMAEVCISYGGVCTTRSVSCVWVKSAGDVPQGRVAANPSNLPGGAGMTIFGLVSQMGVPGRADCISLHGSGYAPQLCCTPRAASEEYARRCLRPWSTLIPAYDDSDVQDVGACPMLSASLNLLGCIIYRWEVFKFGHIPEFYAIVP
eukprot:scaffold174610_cov17-Tisochrysis_lutea.AAC.1